MATKLRIIAVAEQPQPFQQVEGSQSLEGAGVRTERRYRLSSAGYPGCKGSSFSSSGQYSIADRNHQKKKPALPEESAKTEKGCWARVD